MHTHAPLILVEKEQNAYFKIFTDRASAMGGNSATARPPKAVISDQDEMGNDAPHATRNPT